MKKIIKIMILSMMMLMFLSNVVYYAQEDDISVRVRVKGRPLLEQAELDGYENITIYDTSSGSPKKLYQIDDELSILMDTYYNQYYNIMASGSNSKYGPYHVKLSNKSFSTYQEAQNEINNINLSGVQGFYPYFNGQNFEICYGAFTNESSASNIIDTLNKNGFGSTVIEADKKNILVYDGQNNIVFMYKNSYDIYFTSNNSEINSDMIKIDSKPYRGMMGFYIINDTTLISINRVDLESYLYGVVPSESPSTWPIESLKAQALAARTYAASNLNPNAYYGYDLSDDVSSQVYGGYRSECVSTNKAVDETKGEMIYYNGKLIDAVFHSTSGGSTENSENVWANALPYLRGVNDEYSNISPRTIWQKVYTKDQLIARLGLYGKYVNDLYDVKVTKVSENSRAQECIFYTDKGEITFTKDLIRSVLGVDSLWLSVNSNGETSSYNFVDAESTQPSRGSEIDTTETANLTDKYIISSSGKSKITQNSVSFISSSGITTHDNTVSDSNLFTINGRGWGHSLGMSQYGAKEMASEGFTYDEIIKHYYTGVIIQ